MTNITNYNLGRLTLSSKEITAEEVQKYVQYDNAKDWCGKAFYVIKLLFTGRGLLLKDKVGKLIENNKDFNKIVEKYPEFQTIFKINRIALLSLEEQNKLRQSSEKLNAQEVKSDEKTKVDTKATGVAGDVLPRDNKTETNTIEKLELNEGKAPENETETNKISENNESETQDTPAEKPKLRLVESDYNSSDVEEEEVELTPEQLEKQKLEEAEAERQKVEDKINDDIWDRLKLLNWKTRVNEKGELEMDVDGDGKVDPAITCHQFDANIDRDKSVLSPEKTSIKIKNQLDEEERFHANLVDDILATQAPLEGEIGYRNFWYAMYQENCEVIFNLTNEDDRNTKKGLPVTIYAPQNKGDIKIYGDIQVTLQKVQTDVLINGKKIEGMTARTYEVKLKNNSIPKTITCYDYEKWPDNKGIEPNILNDLLDLKENHKKVAVHCRAGGGRTGSFIVAALLRKKIKEFTLENFKTQIGDLVYDTRQKGGPAFVQSKSQLLALFNYYLSLNAPKKEESKTA